METKQVKYMSERLISKIKQIMEKSSVTAVILIVMILCICTQAAAVIWRGFYNMPSNTVFNVTADLLCSICIPIAYFGCVRNRNQGSLAQSIFLLMLMVNEAVLTADCATWIFNGVVKGIVFNYIGNIGYYLGGALLLILYWIFYLGNAPEQPGKDTITLITFGAAAAAIITLILNPFLDLLFVVDEEGYYHRTSLTVLFVVLLAVIVTLEVTAIGFNHEMKVKERVIYMIYPIVPATALIAQVFTYGFSYAYIFAFFTMFLVYTAFYMKRGEEIIEKDAELVNQKMDIMISQIQPHFVFNSLNTICYLCRTDPDKAEEATGEFAGYLRANIDSFGNKEAIPFEKEVKHTKTYIKLEQLRFQDEFDIAWKLEEMNFRLPALTLQPIVENAIKHGFKRMQTGNHLEIHSYRNGSDYIVSVVDNGCGFDENEKPDDGREHIGMANVRSRLETMCSGKLIVNSTPGEGTRVDIVVPVGK